MKDLPRSVSKNSLIHVTDIAKVNFMLNILSSSLGKLNTKTTSQIIEVLHCESLFLFHTVVQHGCSKSRGFCSPPGIVSGTHNSSILCSCSLLSLWSLLHSANGWGKRGQRSHLGCLYRSGLHVEHCFYLCSIVQNSNHIAAPNFKENIVYLYAQEDKKMGFDEHLTISVRIQSSKNDL